MALTTTTLSAACAASDTQISVTSATGFAAGNRLIIDGENFTVINSYLTGTIIPVLRGQNGTVAVAHVSGANVTTGLSTDFANAGPQQEVTYPTAGRVRTLISYSAAGAIALPTPGTDAVAIINGTSTLAMTVANPTKDMDGSVLTILANGKSASTVDFDDTVGLNGAGSSYDTITFQNAGQSAISMMACNGAWVLVNSPITGTVTAMSVAIA